MKTSLIILFLLISPITYSQFNFQSDIDKMPLYPEIEYQLDSIYPDFDFQFRFWIDGPLLRTSKKRLFTITLRNDNWTCTSYKFANKQRNDHPIIKPEYQIYNCDSVWNYFMRNKILDLPTMGFLETKFSDLKEDEGTVRILIADGQGYSLEFIDKNKYRRLQYHCPITYEKAYPEIHELSNISNIVKLIFTIAKIKYEPC